MELLWKLTGLGLKHNCYGMCACVLSMCSSMNSHPKSAKDPMHHRHLAPQLTSPPFHKQFNTNRQQPTTSNLKHTKLQSYKSTSLQRAITHKPTNPQPTTASNQQHTYNPLPSSPVHHSTHKVTNTLSIAKPNHNSYQNPNVNTLFG